MEDAAWLASLEADLPRMVTAVEVAGLNARVPGAPDWSVRDLVEHVAAVFEHKIAVIETRQRPKEWKREDADVVGWLIDAHSRLAHALTSAPPETALWTWHPEHQDLRFWIRRMAQELLVHRIDAEQAAGLPSAIDVAMAADGVDEFVTRFIDGGWEGTDELGGHGETVALHGGGDWLITVHPHHMETAVGAGTAVATISSEPAELLLWVWRRGELPDGAVSGDEGAVQMLRDALAIATQ